MDDYDFRQYPLDDPEFDKPMYLGMRTARQQIDDCEFLGATRVIYLRCLLVAGHVRMNSYSSHQRIWRGIVWGYCAVMERTVVRLNRELRDTPWMVEIEVASAMKRRK